MRLRTFRSVVTPFSAALVLSLASCLFAPDLTSAQTTQAFVFAGATLNNAPAIAVFARDDTTGVLTPVLNSPFPVRDAAQSFAIDAQARFLFGSCNHRICMYLLDKDTGAVQEVPNSPFSSSSTTNPIFIAGESTGQYLYAVNGVFAQSGSLPQPGSIDVFQIDPIHLALLPYQNTSSVDYVIDAAMDPRTSTLYTFLGTNPTTGLIDSTLTAYDFDFTLNILSQTQTLVLGQNSKKLLIDPQARYLAAAHGSQISDTDVFRIVQPLSPTEKTTVVYAQPTSGEMIFDNSGKFFYNWDGTNVRIYDPSTGSELPSSPLPSTSPGISSFSGWVADPTGPFFYLMTSSGIQVYGIDPSTGYTTQATALSSPFGQGIVSGPIFSSLTPGQQPVASPAILVSTNSIAFGDVIVGQTSPPQQVVVTSNGSQGLSLNSISIGGPNAADFSETDNCGVPTVLKPQSSCTVSVTFTPHTMGISSQALLVFTDNASGSPQQVSLSGSGNSPSPAVTLVPGSLAFPAVTEGTTGTPQTVTLTNAGTATLHITGVSLSGGNSADFSLATKCGGALAVSQTCTIVVSFAPLASGTRQTTVVINDDAGTQSFTVTGKAAPAVTVGTAPNGSTTATVTAGQSAQYNLQATPGPGFAGTITFTCSGAPFGAACNVPASVSVSNGVPTPFSISISTLAASQIVPLPTLPSSPSSRVRGQMPLLFCALLATLLASALFVRAKTVSRDVTRWLATAAATTLLGLLIYSGIGCGSSAGSSQATPQTSHQPPPQTAAVPSIQPAGGTFTGPQSVSITDATAGATIHYTTDGSTPSASSPAYSSAISLSSAAVVQAIAASGTSTSAVPAPVSSSRRRPAPSSSPSHQRLQPQAQPNPCR